LELKIKKLEQDSKMCIVYLEGRLDVHYSTEIEEAINALIKEGYTKLLINLKKVSYLSSSGLRIFIAIARELKAKDGKVKLVEMPEAVKKIFIVVELLDMFEIYNSDDEAIRSFS